MYFHLPPQEIPLSVMFERMELAKSQLNILEYALSQTTLEQVCSCERHSYAECASNYVACPLLLSPSSHILNILAFAVIIFVLAY